MTEVTEFFTLDGSPAQPQQRLVRDNYGFPVLPPYDELFLLYSPVWDAQETGREAAWAAYLSVQATHADPEGGSFTDLQDLCDYLQDAVTVARDERQASRARRDELDSLVQGGVPFTIRGRAWTVFLDTSVRKQRNYYNDLVKRCLGDLAYRGCLEMDEIREQALAASAALQDAAELHGLSGYAEKTEANLAVWRAHSKVWLTQIEKDLPRTFPGLQLMEASGRPALRRVLAAYSLHNSRVGYCQGLNFVAGTLLLFLDEEEAFWCLCALLQDILKGYYDVDMMGMQVDQRVFKRLVVEHFPQLAAHMEGLGADVSCVFVQWFLCVFVNFLPIEAGLRVWDALFYYRSPTVLFKTALALLEVFTPALFVCSDVLDVLDALQSMAPYTYDSNRLIAHAFGPSFEGVTDVRLATLRRECREEVEAEAERVDDMAWESSSRGSAHASAAAVPAVVAAPQQTSKISVLKMFARGMKEKLAGVGVGVSGGSGAGNGSGTGANSVERAASPAPEALLMGTSPTAAATGLLGGSGGGGGGGGGAEEPLLVQALSLRMDGGGGGGGGPGGAADADSEDYNRVTGEEAFEQVGYVAPSDLSETASNAAVLVGLPGEDDRSGGGGGGGSAVGTLLPSSPPPAGDAARAIAAGAPPAADPLAFLLAAPAELPGAASAPSASAASASADGGGAAAALRPAANRRASSVEQSSPSFMWHETPKWISIRATHSLTAAATGDVLSPSAASVTSTTAAALSAAKGPAASDMTAVAAPPPGQLSPHVLMLAAGRSQSHMGRLPSAGGGELAAPSTDADGDAGALPPLQLDFAGPDNGAAATVIATAATAPEAVAGPGQAVLEPASVAVAAVAPLPAAPSSSSASSLVTGAAAFSQVQAADQARRAQSSRRRTTKPWEKLAWDIAMAPIKKIERRQQLELQQQQQALSSQQPGQGQQGQVDAGGGQQAQQGGQDGGRQQQQGQQGQQAAEARVQGPLGLGAIPQQGQQLQQQQLQQSQQSQSQGGTGPAAARSLGNGSLPHVASAPGLAGMGAHTPTPAASIPGSHDGPAGLPPPHPHGQPHLIHSNANANASNAGHGGGGGGGSSAYAQAQAHHAAALHQHLHNHNHIAAHGSSSSQQQQLLQQQQQLHVQQQLAAAAPGSSVQSTGSMMMVGMDEHREALPAEARDESWVIMSAPGDGSVGRLSGAGSGQAGPSGRGLASHYGGPYHHSGAGVGPPSLTAGAAAAAGGSRPQQHRHGSIGSMAGAGAGGGHGDGSGAGSRASGSGGGGGGSSGGSRERETGGLCVGGGGGGTSSGQSPDGDIGQRGAQELRESLGANDILDHYAALSARLRTHQAAVASGQDRASSLPPTPTGGGPRAADPIGLTSSLERLSQLQHLLESLTMAAAATGAAAGTAAEGSAGTGTAPGTPTAGGGTAAAAGSSGSRAAAATAPFGAAPIAAAAGGSGISAPPPLPDGLLPLALPLPTAGPAVTPFDQLVVGPGGQVRLQPAAPPLPPLAVPSTSALLPMDSGCSGGYGVPASAAGTPSAAAAAAAAQPFPQQQELQRALGLCSQLRGGLEQSRQRGNKSEALLGQYGVLCEVLAEKLEEVVRQLADQQGTMRALESQYNRVMHQYAAAEDANSDKEDAIRHLQLQLNSSTFSGASGASGSGLPGLLGNGGGGAGGGGGVGGYGVNSPLISGITSVLSGRSHYQVSQQQQHVHQQQQQQQLLQQQPPAAGSSSGFGGGGTGTFWGGGGTQQGHAGASGGAALGGAGAGGASGSAARQPSPMRGVSERKDVLSGGGGIGANLLKKLGVKLRGQDEGPE